MRILSEQIEIETQNLKRIQADIAAHRETLAGYELPPSTLVRALFDLQAKETVTNQDLAILNGAKAICSRSI